MSDWWKVSLRCVGKFQDSASLCVPLYNSKTIKNLVVLYNKNDMPEKLWHNIYVGMSFNAMVPTNLHTDKDFKVKDVEVPDTYMLFINEQAKADKEISNKIIQKLTHDSELSPARLDMLKTFGKIKIDILSSKVKEYENLEGVEKVIEIANAD